MTTDEIYAHFQASCDLVTRDLDANLPLPATLQPRPHMHITDVNLFASACLTRLHNGSAPLTILADRSLRALIEHLKNTPN